MSDDNKLFDPMDNARPTGEETPVAPENGVNAPAQAEDVFHHFSETPEQEISGETALPEDAKSEEAPEDASGAFGQSGENASQETPPANSGAGFTPRPGGYPYGSSGAYPYGTPGSAYRRGAPQPGPGTYAQPGGQTPSQPGPAYDPTRQGNPYGTQTPPYDPYRSGAQGYAYPNTPAPKKSKAGKVVIAVLLALAILVGVGVILAVSHAAQTTPTKTVEGDDGRQTIDNVSEVVTNHTPAIEASVGADGTLDPTQVYEKILPSSVGVLVYSKSTGKLVSEGSGVIYMADETGEYTYIVTCAHVIKGSGQNIMVQLSTNEKEYEATVIGYDSRTDIGVLRIKESGLTAAEIGDSDALVVGETVYAIGNPGGTEFAFTFTNGIVTALDRPVSSSSTGYTMECIQHNVAINPGNSGGALVNRFGQLIGINSMKIVAADYEGMGFSVPSSVFVKVVNELVANGYVTSRPKIGISYVKAADEQAYAMFVAIKGLPAGSIVIASVSEDSDLYGKLEVGDLVTAINGKTLDSATDLAAYVETMKVGDPITLEVVRIKKDYTFTEHTISGVLVEDKETAVAEEEETTSYFDDYFGNRGNSGDSGDSGDSGNYGESGGSNPYAPFSDDFFREFYERFFGGSNP